MRSPKRFRLEMTSQPRQQQPNESALRRPFKIAVEGNIAAGKSTFVSLMAKDGHLKMCTEPVLDWTNIKLVEEASTTGHKAPDNNLLAKFYGDPKRWALTFQNYALFSRVVNQPRLDHNETGVYLCERSVYSDRLVFGKNGLKTGIMTPLEYSIYCKWHAFLTDNNTATDVDGFIYMRSTPETCMSRLARRGRAEEDSVSMEYLQQIHDRHEEWLMKKKELPSCIQKKPVLVLDCTGDLINDAELRSAMVKQVLSFAELLKNPSVAG